MDIKINGGMEYSGSTEKRVKIVNDQKAEIKVEAELKKEKLKIAENSEPDVEKPMYNYEDAVMDLETIKRFLYMLAGIPYTPKEEEISAENHLTRWA